MRLAVRYGSIPTGHARTGQVRARRTRQRGEPAAGLVRHATPVSDREVLVRRIAGETLVVFSTPGESRAEHVAAGVADLQRGWLAVTAAGLVASVITQAVYRAGLCGRLAKRLALAGTPQMILRFGCPP